MEQEKETQETNSIVFKTGDIVQLKRDRRSSLTLLLWKDIPKTFEEYCMAPKNAYYSNVLYSYVDIYSLIYDPPQQRTNYPLQPAKRFFTVLEVKNITYSIRVGKTNLNRKKTFLYCFFIQGSGKSLKFYIEDHNVERFINETPLQELVRNIKSIK